MSDFTPPQAEGTTSVRTQADSRGFIPKKRLLTGSAKFLSEMCGEYQFFTPAPLYLYAGFHDAPLVDFMHSVGQDVVFYYLVFPNRVFDGLDAVSNGDRTWNYALWAIELPLWQRFSDFLVSTVLMDSAQKKVWGIGQQSLRIRDPLAAPADFGGGNAPTIEITAFGINGGDYRAAFRVSGAVPKLTKFPGDPAMVAYAKALYAGQNAVHARQTFKRNCEVKHAD